MRARQQSYFDGNRSDFGGRATIEAAIFIENHAAHFGFFEFAEQFVNLFCACGGCGGVFERAFGGNSCLERFAEVAVKFGALFLDRIGADKGMNLFAGKFFDAGNEFIGIGNRRCVALGFAGQFG